MANYLLVPNLKMLSVDVLVKKLDISNCISIFYFALEKYQCKEFLCRIQKFIFSNFITVSNREEFLNLSEKEVGRWISSDEIEVSSEEDVFKVILAWIGHDKTERKKYFPKLFRQVRLVYVSRNCLTRDIMSNDLVKENEHCLERVEEALNVINSKNINHIAVKPRKSLETPVIVVGVETSMLCFFPRERRWCKFGKNSISRKLNDHELTTFKFVRKSFSRSLDDYELAACRGKLYFINTGSTEWKFFTKMLCYDSLSNRWTLLQDTMKGERCLKHIFVRNDDEMYALLSEGCQECGNLSCLCCRGFLGQSSRGKKLASFLTRYKPKSNSWEDIASFDFGLREGMCVVTKGSAFYFVGGGVRVQYIHKSLSDVDRYDLRTNRWDKVTNIQEERMFACGAASQERIFVAGGVNDHFERVSKTCEVYNETTNEWQFIASLVLEPGIMSSMVCVDGKLYIVGGCHETYPDGKKIQWYDPEKNEWKDDTDMPIGQFRPPRFRCPQCWRGNSELQWSRWPPSCYFNVCPMTVFTGFISHLGLQPLSSWFRK